jgi:hypothetical protein
MSSSHRQLKLAVIWADYARPAGVPGTMSETNGLTLCVSGKVLDFGRYERIAPTR